MPEYPIIAGDRPAELQALQILSLSLVEAASRLSPKLPSNRAPTAVTTEIVAAPLLMAAARAASLGCLAGLDTPIEVLALSVRNIFELWLRLLHIIQSDENRQVWRNETFKDQLEVYNAMLTLEGPESVKFVIRGEIQRVQQQADSRGLNPGKPPKMMRDLVKETKCKEDYDAFYKLYSKLVHPSAWFVNMPTSVASEMYRTVLVVNAQVYGWQILKTVESEFGVSSDHCRQVACAQFAEPKSTAVH
jgi:hypothetical protein